MKLPEELIELLEQANPCFITTLMPDGSPQLTMTWVDTDGKNVLINTVETHKKVSNIRNDPRVAVGVVDLQHPSRYYAVRGRVVEICKAGAVDHINKLSQRYMGQPYPRPTERVILTIEADSVYPTKATQRAQDR